MQTDLLGQTILDPDEVFVESFTNPEVKYVVNKTRQVCTCPASGGKKICKHVRKVLHLPLPSEQLGVQYSLLKSALQKCVRRNKTELAVRIAKDLMRGDMMQFLRRLPVIMIEDSLPHPDMHKIIPLIQRVGRKDELTVEEKSILLKLTADIANVKWRMFFGEDGTDPKWKDIKQYRGQGRGLFSTLPEAEKDIVGVVLYRSKIGGMKGDEGMLGLAVDELACRFGTGDLSAAKLRDYFLQDEWKGSTAWDDVKHDVLKREIPSEAVDGHICPIDKVIAREYSLEPDDVFDAIWLMRSSVDVKKDIDLGRAVDWFDDLTGQKPRDVIEKRWERIRGRVENFSQWWIRK